MKQGCIGDVAFFVSPSEVHTWRNMERKRSINFGEHAVLELSLIHISEPTRP